MPIDDFDLRAKMLRETLKHITIAPEDKSLNQLREEAIIQVLQEVAEQARMWAVVDDLHAVGKTPEEAIVSLAHFKGWGEVTKISELDGGDPKYTWGRRFLADGTSMKAAGWEVPGGVIVAWWK